MAVPRKTLQLKRKLLVQSPSQLSQLCRYRPSRCRYMGAVSCISMMVGSITGAPIYMGKSPHQIRGTNKQWGIIENAILCPLKLTTHGTFLSNQL